MPRELTMFLTAIPVCQWKENSIVLRNSGSSGDSYRQCCPYNTQSKKRQTEGRELLPPKECSPGMHTTVFWEFNQVIGSLGTWFLYYTVEKRASCSEILIQWARYRRKGNRRRKNKIYMLLLEACCYENTRQPQKFIQLRSRKQRPVALMTPYQSSLIGSVGPRTPRDHDQQQQQIRDSQ